ncbi:carboxypeptidase-like regulatory domain-containing protein [Ancylomarina sp. 16SWW S1-10-2]|uniref:carboxypeptidase-like regulatory domain-containing protein n=1 Tax=Ancylomarina sp. 16SWW S1-10-2 TaxID=2499681 RepID=UPI0012AE7280|nr:carboxypeptidase-like regulatory domain-containing protein [Ancylomarina sp. 16SWW S1-10-2]MRT92325.1 carboxypeptidase-like regulatory domain-containing protein [Ancylomarina sp. 16SWW S1-10-2]
MKKIILNTILLLLISISCFANTIVKGKLTGCNKNPIPYANLVIKNTTIGTISNLDGYFSINIPDEYEESSLVFSSIGFKTKEIRIKTFEKKDICEIELEIATVNLDEVTIKVKATNANEIVQKAFDHYEDNFPTSPFIGKAFLRHTEKTKTKYKWLVDAAIEVYDPGFNQPSKEIKLNIKEIKRSIDNRSLDTADIYCFYLSQVKNISLKKSVKRKDNLADEDPKEIEKAIHFQDNRLSNPRGLFSGGVNVIRYYKQKDAIFDKRILKKHNFKIDTVLSYNSDDIYKIKITPKSPLVKLNKHIGKFRFPIGWIYIRAKDYAIIELEYTLIRSKKGEIFTSLYGSKIASSFHIKYIEINGKMYPKHITLNTPKANNLFKLMTNTVHGAKTNPEDYYYEKQEIIFNEIVTDNAILTKSLEKPWNSNLFTPRPYNSEFWDKYSSMVETEAQKIFREALEKELSNKNRN